MKIRKSHVFISISFSDAKYLQRRLRRRNSFLKGNRRDVGIDHRPAKTKPSKPFSEPNNHRPPRPNRLSVKKEDKSGLKGPDRPFRPPKDPLRPTKAPKGPGLNTIRPTLEVITNPFSGADQPFGPIKNGSSAVESRKPESSSRAPLKKNRMPPREFRKPQIGGMSNPLGRLKQQLGGLRDKLAGGMKQLSRKPTLLSPAHKNKVKSDRKDLEVPLKTGAPHQTGAPKPGTPQKIVPSSENPKKKSAIKPALSDMTEKPVEPLPPLPKPIKSSVKPFNKDTVLRDTGDSVFTAPWENKDQPRKPNRGQLVPLRKPAPTPRNNGKKSPGKVYLHK